MHLLVLLWALLAAPFWESKPPRQWTDRELIEMLSNSPWARAATAGGIVRAPGVQTYLASALPMQEAPPRCRGLRSVFYRHSIPIDGLDVHVV